MRSYRMQDPAAPISGTQRQGLWGARLLYRKFATDANPEATKYMSILEAIAQSKIQVHPGLSNAEVFEQALTYFHTALFSDHLSRSRAKRAF